MLSMLSCTGREFRDAVDSAISFLEQRIQTDRYVRGGTSNGDYAQDYDTSEIAQTRMPETRKTLYDTERP